VFIAAGVAWLFWHMAWLSVPMVDDAATSVSYALSLFHGAGLRLTPLSQRVEAFSNPLWVLLSGVGVPLHLDLVPFTQGLGQGLGALALVAFCLWGPLGEGRRLRISDAIPVVASLAAGYAYWCASGMESGLVAFLLGLSGALLLLELRRGKGSFTGLALALLCLSRPEGVLYVFAAGSVWCLAKWRARQRLGLQEAKIAAWLVVVFGGYLLFRRGYFASWLPNTYYAKLGWDFSAGSYFTSFMTVHAVLLALAALGLVVALVVSRLSPGALLPLAYLAAGAFFAWRSGGDWMREWRFFAPLLPVLGAAVAVGLSSVRARWPSVRALDVLALVALAVAGLAEHGAGVSRGSELKRSPEFPITWTVPAHTHAHDALAHFGIPRPQVALADIGGAGLVWRDAEVIDSAGLGDYALAHHTGNKAAMEDYLLAQLPALVDAHGPSGHLRDMPRLMANYVPAGVVFPELRGWNGLMLLKGLTATEDPACPGGKARVLALGVPALEAELESLATGSPEQAVALWRCAWRYQPEEALPQKPWRSAQADAAEARGKSLSERGEWLAAAHAFDLAMTLDSSRAGDRAAAERNREKAFPRPLTH
jgi:hypothetical protein